MSYETHVTMVINCFATSVYVYAVFELITWCLAIIAVTAKHVPPTDCFAMFFNLWFGFLTICIVTVTMPLLRSLFFADAYKLKLAEGDFSIMGLTKEGITFKCSINESGAKIIDVASNLANKIAEIGRLTVVAVCSKSPEPVQPTAAQTTQDSGAQPLISPGTPTAAQTAQASSAQPPKSPGTPDSEQCSQADTERFADNLGEIKPVGV